MKYVGEALQMKWNIEFGSSGSEKTFRRSFREQLFYRDCNISGDSLVVCGSRPLKRVGSKFKLRPIWALLF